MKRSVRYPKIATRYYTLLWNEAEHSAIKGLASLRAGTEPEPWGSSPKDFELKRGVSHYHAQMQAREGENIDRRHLLLYGSSTDHAKRSEQGELKFKLQLISKPKLLDIDDTSVVDK